MNKRGDGALQSIGFATVCQESGQVHSEVKESTSRGIGDFIPFPSHKALLHIL